MGEQWLKDVDATLKTNPFQTVFSAAANDTWNAGHCICENCRAWDDLSAPRRMFSWEGLAQEYVALSDRQVRFANVLARKLKERYPDRQYYVAILAYGFSRPAPTSAVPDDNVIISSVANFLFNPYHTDRASDGVKEIDQFKAWAKVAPQLYWRPNVTNNVQTGVPLNTDLIGGNMKLLAESNGIGMFVDTMHRHWALNAPAYYLLVRQLWNPQQDAQAVLDDFFERGFGPAASDLKQYQSLLNQARMKHRDQGDGTEAQDWAQAYNTEFFNQGEALLKAAAEKVQGDEKLEHRVAFMTAGLKLLKLQVEGRLLGAKILSKQGDKAEHLAQMKRLWEQVEAIEKQYPQAVPRHYLMQLRNKPVQANPKRYE